MQFLVGEVREIGIEVTNSNGQDFIIEAAEYEIHKGKEILENGHATIDGHKILTLFSATDVGKYYCKFTYHIGPEILKAIIIMEVV